MGKLVWHEYSRYVAITASICACCLLWLPPANSPNLDTVWAGYFGLLYRKFFWDFVSGIRRNPGGLQCVLIFLLSLSFLNRFLSSFLPRPANQDAFFIDIMVKTPVIQTTSILIGLVILALEYPAPFMKGTAMHRNLITRVVLLVFQIFFAIMFYQVRVLSLVSEQMNNREYTGYQWRYLVARCSLWLQSCYNARGGDERSEGK